MEIQCSVPTVVNHSFVKTPNLLPQHVQEGYGLVPKVVLQRHKIIELINYQLIINRSCSTLFSIVPILLFHRYNLDRNELFKGLTALN